MLLSRRSAASLRTRGVAYVPAAAGAYAAFLVHAGLDWDWELPAVVVAALCCAAAVATAELEPGRALGRRCRGMLLAVSFALGGVRDRRRAQPHGSGCVPRKRQRAPHSGALSQTRA